MGRDGRVEAMSRSIELRVKRFKGYLRSLEVFQDLTFKAVLAVSSS